MEYIKKNKLLVLFCILSSIGIISFFIYALFSGNNAFEWLVMEHSPHLILSDYFRHIAYAANLDTLYNTMDSCFPPLAYVIYRFFYLINPSFSGDITIVEGNFEHYYIAPYNMWISIGGIILLVILFYKIINCYLNNNKISWLFIICLLFSLPFFAGVIERNNMAFLILIVLLFALYFKDSKNKILQEVALFLFAFATALKLYPLAFCLLYLFEKKYAKFLRLLAYSILMIVGPFFILGDIEVLFPKFLNSLLGVNNANVVDWKNLPSLFRLLNNTVFHIDNSYVSNIILAIQFLYALLVVTLSYITKYDWRKMLYISSLMIIFVNKSYRYTLIYLVIPLIFFLKDYKQLNKIKFSDIIITILFATVFSIPIIYTINEPEIVSYIALYTLIIFVIIIDIIDLIKYRKSKK